MHNLSEGSKALFLLVIFGILQSIYNIFIPIHGDEAYYWVWSKNLDWSYYDHPAMVAWLMAPFSYFGTNAFLMRLPTVICLTATAYYLFKLTLEVSDKKSAWTFLLIFMVIPIVQMGYVFITPDSPLMMFWAIGMYYTYLAINYGKTRYFIIAGIATGCMMLSKYAGLLFPVSVFIYILVRRRDILTDFRLWLTVVIAALFVIPIFYWNYQHDFVSILFQYQHGTSSGFKIVYKDFILFVLGSLLVPTPILAAILIRFIFDKKAWVKDNSLLFLMILTLVPMLFFFYKGLFKKMELNWIVVAYMSGTVLLAIATHKYQMWRTFKYGCGFAILLSFLIKLSPFLPLPPNLNAADRILGFEEGIDTLKGYIKQGDNIYSDHSTTAALVEFYTEHKIPIYINIPAKFGQYQIWNKEDKTKKGVYFGRNNRVYELNQVFDNVTLLEVKTVAPKNAKPKTFYYYRVE